MVKIFLTVILFYAGVCLYAQVNPVTSYNNSFSDKNIQTTGSGRIIEFTPIMGYQLNGKIEFIEGDFKMDNAVNYGGMLSVKVGPGTYGEFTFTRSDTKAFYRRFFDSEVYKYNMSVNYFQFGGVKEAGHGRVLPFGLFEGGVTWFQMKDKYVDNEAVFSVSLGGGVKVWLNDRIGLRLQGRFLMPLYVYGSGFFVGIGTGGPSAGLSMNTNLLTLQGDFTGGLIFRLGN
ncbi:MAG: hypothetical protein GXO47_11415 [Chlorobi bacterium]|nr:hypothetical protein [Chlorobiota bacterium]